MLWRTPSKSFMHLACQPLVTPKDGAYVARKTQSLKEMREAQFEEHCMKASKVDCSTSVHPHCCLYTFTRPCLCYRRVIKPQCSSVCTEVAATRCQLSWRPPTSTPGSRQRRGECVHSAGRRSACCSLAGTLDCAWRIWAVNCAASTRDCQRWPSFLSCRT